MDILAGEMVLGMKEEFPEIQLIAVLPFEEQANTWGEFWREKYFTLLEHCDDVITLQLDIRRAAIKGETGTWWTGHPC